MALEGKKIPMTYRCKPELHMRIEALKSQEGLSFQRIVDDLINELFWKLQHEADMFKDLSMDKKAHYVVKSLIEQSPVYKRFFSRAIDKN